MTRITTKTAAEIALGVDLPTRREEDWKWTDLKRMISTGYASRAVEANVSDVERLLKLSPLAALKLQRIIFVNGVLHKRLSQLEGLDFSATLPKLSDDETVVQMNVALAAEGLTLRFSGSMDQPLEILHVVTDAAPRAVATRHHIVVDAGAVATVIETYLGEGDYLNNAVVDYQIGEGARLDRVKLDRESGKATHLSHVFISLAKNAIVRDFTLTNGAALVRQNGSINFDGSGADARVSGAYLLSGHQHADTKLVVDHKVPHCVSREVFKCVMDEHSRGIFQGKVIVRPHAQKTDGKQSSHALLLSETAEFDAKPELEIYADDVVCGHGATSGDLNHDHLFYLQSRGIPENVARGMLVKAFIAEAIETIENEAIRDCLLDYLQSQP